MRLNLFWKIFFSMLVTVVLVVVFSVRSEFWLRERATKQTMMQHLEQLLEQRDLIRDALRRDELSVVRTIFAQQPTLAREIRITTPQGEPLFWVPREASRKHTPNPPSEHSHKPHNSLDIALSAYADEREELIQSMAGERYVLTLTPRLSMEEWTAAGQQKNRLGCLFYWVLVH
ncbi:hypothetical protein L0B52_07960 [Suttonella sp. R2A3]|uniref:hypothetical protein n=1 Tax=Suttonella sp. R2A3 TaxID=2908648 RepID=UPI001F348E9F|nr:hypothetical protein [Suttonella sp. R2A3]UJF24263.1 hypothetical protein L0B52_07960 [Suttonella sp. R2A3]